MIFAVGKVHGHLNLYIIRRMVTSTRSFVHKVWHSLGHYFAAISFFGGFLWDAITLGKTVQQSDLLILSGYLLGSVLILFWLAHLSHDLIPADNPHVWYRRAPYFLLQFLFGSMLSALFVLYFKSSSHWFALLWSLGLAGLLVGNEYLEEHYEWLPLSWSMFGLCSILLLNFLIPTLLGSVHWVWFYISTLIGVSLTHWLYARTHDKAGHIFPVWVIAFVLAMAYRFDWIPPVPLVKERVIVGSHLVKKENTFVLQVDKAEWWRFGLLSSNRIHLLPGESLYFVSSVFAPVGLKATLYHRWEYHDAKRGWVTASRIGFNLNGGRKEGFRGFTYLSNWRDGDWRVSVETEDGRTISTDHFRIDTMTGSNLTDRSEITI